MPRPTDIASKATTESRRKGALAANAKRRELGLSLRERIARHLERRAEELAAAFARAMAIDWSNVDREERQCLHAAIDEIVRAIREDERPEQLLEIPSVVFHELVHALPTRPASRNP
jgi:hypothetical protein